MLIKDLIKNNENFAVVISRNKLLDSKDFFLVSFPDVFQKYKLRNDGYYKFVKTHTLGNKEIVSFKKLIPTEFKVAEQGSFGQVYERKTKSFREEFKSIQAKANNNKGNDNE